MPVIHFAVRDTSTRRAARTIRHAAMVTAAIAMTAAAGLAAAGLAHAATSAQGTLTFSPASGATSLTPTWSTTTGCPAGYQGSAELSEFKAGGTLASRISPVVNSGLTTAFTGTLDGNIGSLLHVTHIKNGGTIKVTIGCYSLSGGTGKVTWNQTATLTLSATGTTYTASTASSASTGGSGSPMKTVLIAVACALVIALALVAMLRRRRCFQLT